MRILFLSNTLYQMIVACCIREMYSSDEAELVLSDHSTGNEIIATKLKKDGSLFNQVYYVKTHYLYERDNSMNRRTRVKEISNIQTVPSMSAIDGKYDMFFCANAEPFSSRLVNYVKNTNKDAIICWFEEGLSAYSFDRRYFPTTGRYIKNKFMEKLNFYSVPSIVEKYFVFFPEKMEWKPRACLERISPMSTALYNSLAKIFNLKESPDQYSEKYIFLEDGARDWAETDDDIKLLNAIADVIGKENIIVRLHPRNAVNRFKALGYKTNIDNTIPWEILSGQIDIEKKVLITIYSQSVFTPEQIYGKKGKAIFLAKLDLSLEEEMKPLVDFEYHQYLSKDPSRYYVPTTMKELMEILHMLKIQG